MLMVMEFTFAGHPEDAVNALHRAIRTGVPVLLPGTLEAQVDPSRPAAFVAIGEKPTPAGIGERPNVARDGRTTRLTTVTAPGYGTSRA